MSRQLVFKKHALHRMAARDIAESDVEFVIKSGKIIELYPDDVPYPSRLMLAFIDSRPVHVVVADNLLNDETYIITAYEPDQSEWELDFKRRRFR